MSLLIQQTIVGRLSGISALSKVDLALGVPDLTKQIIVGDAQAWVIELLATPLESLRDMGPPVQQEHQTYAVLIGLRNHNDATGANAVNKLEVIRLAVRAALFGAVPQEGHDHFTLAGAELLRFSPSAIYWVERFKTSHYICEEDLL